MNNNRLMTPGQVADFLSVGTTAIKKYATLLEDNGYTIGRNDKNHRVYTGEDVAVIRAMLILNRHKSVPLEDAASIVTSADTDIAKILSYDGTNSGSHTTELTDTPTHVPESSQQMAELMAQLQAHDARYKQFVTGMENSMREQTSTIEGMREEMQEHNRQQAETIEALRKEIEALRNAQSDKPTSFWARLFGGK